jgi:hypothetical protein
VAHGGTITIETGSVSGLTVSPTWTSNFPLCQETLQRVQFSIMPRTLQRVTESDSALTLYSALGLAYTRPWALTILGLGLCHRERFIRPCSWLLTA